MTGQDPLAVAALRAGSVEAREPLARLAGDDPWLLGELARVIALQNLRPGDHAEALGLLARAGRLAPEHQGLYAQLALVTGDRDRAATLLREHPDIPEPVRTALAVDLANPYTGGSGPWNFADLLPAPAVRVDDGAGSAGTLAPFDRLTTAGVQRVGHPARITSIVTAYQPGPELLTSVRSLVAQTWTNHEILLIDDASPHGHDEVLRRAAALDPRIRLLRMPVNGGTYLARNAGLDAATGTYVTFQDSDDWSHPLRLETQVAPLLADPTVFSTTSTGMRVTPDLRVTRLGFGQTRSYNISSLLFRREVALRRLGHLDSVRKGGDAEYVERARAVFGRPATRHLNGPPLALIRLSGSSLSSPDYRPGWMHPARRSYLSAFQTWHRHVAAGAVDPAGLPPFCSSGALQWNDKAVTRPFAAPRRILGHSGRRVFDVVLAADWTEPDAGLGQARALRDRGLRVGLLHLDDSTNLRHHLANLRPDVQDAINDGEFDQIELCDDVRTRLVVVRSPSVLRHPPAGRSHLRTDRVVIEAAFAAAPRRGVASSRRLFGVDPLWAPPGPAGRRTLASTPGGLALTELDLPGTVDVAGWRVDRRGPRADRPVAGRHCRDGRAEWRRLRDQLPDPARVDVRLLDGAGTAGRAFGRGGPPDGWLVYQADDLSLRNFLYQVDFYLPLPADAAPTDAGPDVLAALAAGCLVVLPPRYAPTFGDAAIYCDPAGVTETVRGWHGRRTAAARQSVRAREFVQRSHGHDQYAERVATLAG